MKELIGMHSHKTVEQRRWRHGDDVFTESVCSGDHNSRQRQGCGRVFRSKNGGSEASLSGR